MSQPAEQTISKDSHGTDSELGKRHRDENFTEEEINLWIKVGKITKRAKNA
jgi:hypothetical protein